MRLILKKVTHKLDVDRREIQLDFVIAKLACNWTHVILNATGYSYYVKTQATMMTRRTATYKKFHTINLTARKKALIRLHGGLEEGEEGMEMGVERTSWRPLRARGSGGCARGGRLLRRSSESRGTR